MASPTQKANALVKLLQMLETQPELPGIPARPIQKPLIPVQPSGTAAEARTPMTKSEFNTLSDNELLGVGDPRYNEYQKAIIEESQKHVEPDRGPNFEGNVHGDRKLTGDEEVAGQQKGDVISLDQQQHGNTFSLQELLDNELSLSERSRSGERGLAPTIHNDYTKRVKSTGGPSERAKQRANSPTYKDEDGVERYKFATKGHQEAAKNAKKEFVDESGVESTDFEGQAMDEELQRIGDILAKEGANNPDALREVARLHAKQALADENVNGYIQSIGTRFEDTFMNQPFKANQGTKEFPVKQAMKQGSFGSVIRDKWNAYDKFARIARDDRFPKEKRREAVREIIEIDKWLAGQDIQPQGQGELLGDLGRYSQPSVSPKQNTLRLKQQNQEDNLGPIPRTIANQTKRQSGFDPAQVQQAPGVSGAPRRMSLKDLIKFNQQGKDNLPAISDSSIPAPRDTSAQDNLVNEIRRGVSDREPDGFSMTENQFDQMNINSEIAADAARYADQPVQNKHIPGSLASDDAALDMVMGVQKWQDGKIFIANSPGKTVDINDLTENSLRKLTQDPNTKDIVIAPNDIERLP